MSDIIPPVEPHPLHQLHARPARAFPFGPLTGASALLVSGAGLWVGIGIEETTGLAVARAVIQDAAGAPAPQTLMPFTLAANESRADMWPTRGVVFTQGLTVQATAGTVAGAMLAVLMSRAELAYVIATLQGTR